MAGMPALHVHELNPFGLTPMLAVHGVTGHGARWRPLAEEHLRSYRVLAPDLRGHGYSAWHPPWTLEAHAMDLLEVIEHYELTSVPVLAHSFGCAVALHLTRLAPQRISALVLLDPAVGLPGELAWERARLPRVTFASRAEARAARRSEWTGVSDVLIEKELDEHLEPVDGGWRFRYRQPAVSTAWSEMCRAPALPAAGMRVLLIPALREAYVRPEFVEGLRLSLAEDLVVAGLNCGHQVHLERAGDVAEILTGFLADG
jgi:lipase